jgi:hypothetical protein
MKLIRADHINHLLSFKHDAPDIGILTMAVKKIIGSPSIMKLMIALIKPVSFHNALATITVKNKNSPDKREYVNLICLTSFVGAVVKIIQKTKGITTK